MNLPPFRRTTGELFEQMRQEMEQMFRRFVGDPAGGACRPGTQPWSPHVDIAESDQEVVIKVDLPGVDPQAVEIAVAEGSLILQGENPEDRGQAGTTYHCQERSIGRFYRAIPLPPGSDPDRIEARSAHGVLTIRVPRKPEVQPRKIHVQAQG